MSALSSQSHRQMLGLDCVVIVDCHLSRSAERRLYALLDAHRDNAVGTGVIALHQDWHAPSWIRSGQAQKRLRDGQFAWLDPNVPCRATLVLLLSPSLAGFGRNRALRLTADRVVVWPIEAEFAPIGDQLSSLHDQVGRLETILDTPVAWAARSEAEQRFLAERLTGDTLEPEIWWPLIRGEVAPPKPQVQGPWTVGRHWGQKASLNEVGLAEWQDAWREAWPVATALLGDLELLRGLPPSAPDQVVRHHDPRLLKLKDFLDSLDLFVAIGGNPGALRLPEEILEAMGAGLVVIGSSMTSAGFENVLPGTEACFLGDLASRLLSDNLALETASREQQRYFERRHSAKAYQRRLPQIFGTHNAEPPLIWSGRTKRPGRVLFISDDSRYLEHLPRQLAIAKNLQAPLEPYFLTMARDAGLAERLGFPSEFLLPHTSQTYRALFDRSEAWNQSLDGTYRTLLDRAETW
ncbi:MAG: hypothetical protein ACR2Q4_04215, partial [Geminicoccaceae bacterium]